MKKTPKNAQIFLCEICDFECCNKKDFNRHLSTRKHEILTNPNKNTPKNPTSYFCDCGKFYKHRSTLSSHKKQCTLNVVDSDYKIIMTNALKQMNIQQNELIDELKKKDEIMLEMVSKMGNTTNNTTNNNQFNINMFLNETCKNAMNLSDFIERIEISHDDLENNAQLGFVNGMTKILMDNLKLLTIHERPIHCTDVKRETLYVKDEDVWDKKHSNEKLENAIQEVSRKSLKSLIDWKKTNPDYDDLDSEFSKKSIYMQQHSSGLCQKETFYPKIIHNLAKENSITQLKN